MQYLASDGLIEIFKIHHSTDSEAFRVTAKGMAVLLDYGLADSKDVAALSNEADQIRHDLYATDVRLIWEQISPRSQWCSERLLKSTNREQIPDAVLAFYSGELLENISIAIEIELTQKSSSRYHKKFTDYESGPHDFVFYFAGNPTIASAIYEVSKDISDVIFVCEIDDFLKHESLTRFASHNDHFVLQERIPCVKR